MTDDEAPPPEAEPVRDWLRTRVYGGIHCPVCTQYAKVYRRKINAGMANSLIRMYRTGGRDWVHVPTQIGARSREEGKLAYWGLIEEQMSTRDDGGRQGYWRVTDAGERFIRLGTRVPKYALIYNGRPLGFEGPEVTIREALGSKFNLDELMSA